MNEKGFVKIDSHAHLTSDELFPSTDEIIARAKKASVAMIVNINTDKSTLERGLALQLRYPDYIVNTGSTTPHDVEKEGEEMFPIFRKAAREKKLIAIGETGLDYYYEHAKRDVQQAFFERYLILAEETNLPVVIHCRGEEAFIDLFQIADRHPKVVCLLHCFTGGVSEAQEAVKRGWYISLSGIITFKKSGALREVVKEIPKERILIETDAPYLAPESKRGQINEPSYVGEVLEKIGEIQGVSLEEMSVQTVKNTCAFFQISSNMLKKLS